MQAAVRMSVQTPARMPMQTPVRMSVQTPFRTPIDKYKVFDEPMNPCEFSHLLYQISKDKRKKKKITPSLNFLSKNIIPLTPESIKIQSYPNQR